LKSKTAFLEACQKISEEILNIDLNSPIHIFSHFDADGLTAASILIATLSQIGFNYQIKIIERLEHEYLKKLNKTLPYGSTVIFIDIGTGVIESFLNWNNAFDIFILDHHTPSSEIKLPKNIRLLNPHIYSINGTTELSGAGVVYFVSICIDPKNKKLAPLALIGALGDRQDQGNYSSLIGLNQQIVKDAKELRLISDDVSVWFFDRTRPIISILRYAKIPEIENELDLRTLLEKLNIPTLKDHEKRSFYDLTEEECTALASELIQYGKDPNEIYKHDYLLVNEEFQQLQDTRVFATKLNACGRTLRSDIGISICLGDRKTALRELNSVSQKYSEMIRKGMESGLSKENLKELSGIHFLDGRGSINDRIIGTIVSKISAMKIVKKPVLGCALLSNEKIKVSMRISSRENIIDLSHVLKQAVQKVAPGSEVGGHAAAAGAIISNLALDDFLNYVDQLVLEGLE